MKRPIVSVRARADVRGIAKRIKSENPAAAAKLVAEITSAFQALGMYPLVGEAVDQLQVGLRRFTCGNYVIYFHSDGNRALILRVIHGAQDHENLMR